MSGIQLNLDYGRSGHENVGLRLPGNKKHKRFVQKRRFLERRGFLHSKQNQHQQWKKPRKGQKERSCSVKSQNNQSKVKQHFAGTTPVPKPSISQSTAKPASTNVFSGTLKSCSMAAHSRSSNFVSTVPHSGNSMAALQNHIHIKDNLFSNPLKYVALDCEMVGTGPKGHCSEVARCSIVTYSGDVVYDKYILPTSRVTDFRTRWSGIRPKHLQGATPFVKARCEILQILSGMVVVGHSIQNDFKVLHHSHPAPLIRDVSRIPLLNRKAGFPEQQVVSLRKLTKALLQRDIQTGRMGHSSVEDAKASMELYKHVEVEWEKELAVRCQAEG